MGNGNRLVLSHDAFIYFIKPEFRIKSKTIFVSIFLLILTRTIRLAEGNILNNYQGITQVISYLEPMPMDINSTCQDHILEYLHGVKDLKLWAIKMMDASGKYPSGTLSGNIRSMGNFDQCLDTSHPRGKHRGKYCLLALQYRIKEENSFCLNDCNGFTQSNNRFRRHINALESLINMATANRTILEYEDHWDKGTLPFPKFSFGEFALCLPSTCSAEDVVKLGKTVIDRAVAKLGINITVTLKDENCHTLENGGRDYKFIDIFIISIFVFDFLMVIICTIFSRFAESCRTRSWLSQIVNAFSLTENWHRFTTNQVDKTPNEYIQCLQGMRVLGTSWVIITHATILLAQLPFVNKLIVLKTHDSYAWFIIWNSTLNVDTFLFISGLLRSQKLVKCCSENRKMDVIKTALARYLRLTPPYLFVILFYISVFDKIGSGPYWNYYITRNANACQKFWWRNLLYIDNYMTSGEKCIVQSWYLEADFQLFLFIPLLIYPLCKLKVFGKVLMAICLILSVVNPVLTILLNKFHGIYTLAARNSSLFLYTYKLYIITHNRMSPYLIGSCLAVILHEKRSRKISKLKVIFGWTVCVFLMYATFYWSTDMSSIRYKYNLWESAIYGGFHRFAWATAMAWIVYACQTGYGGPVNTFLSSKIFVYLSKLSYCIFLTHFGVLLYDAAILRQPRHLSIYTELRNGAGDFFFILLISMFLHFFVEAPFLNIINLLY